MSPTAIGIKLNSSQSRNVQKQSPKSNFKFFVETVPSLDNKENMFYNNGSPTLFEAGDGPLDQLIRVLEERNHQHNPFDPLSLTPIEKETLFSDSNPTTPLDKNKPIEFKQQKSLSPRMKRRRRG